MCKSADLIVHAFIQKNVEHLDASVELDQHSAFVDTPEVRAFSTFPATSQWRYVFASGFAFVVSEDGCLVDSWAAPA